MKSSRTLLFAVIGSLTLGLQAFGEETTPNKAANEQMRQTHIEKHEKMAKVHEDAAKCLKDENKSLSECRAKMMESCRSSGMNRGECMAMGKMGRMKGMHGGMQGGMMGEEKSDSKKSESKSSY
ncbi:MAG: hypothetical protein NDJ90_11685 [Oligoflexia bacterium]|nr:hypothetical protein [Oligoflexia bacterium]